MNKMMFVLLAVSAASQAGAANGSGQNLNLTYLTNGSSDQTPFQKIEDLYNRATPMKLNQFLNATDAAIKNWSCVGAKADTTVALLTPLGSVPARVVGKVVVAPATPGTPSEGPLFPGTPGTPEQDKLVTMIALIPTDGSFNMTPEELGNEYSQCKVKLVTSPGVVESFLSDASDATTEASVTYRTIDGLIVGKQESSNSSVMAQQYDYYYCYSQ